MQGQSAALSESLKAVATPASKIIGKCPTYEKPIKEGLKYFVMEYEVEKRWPAFVDLTVEACNVGSAIARPDTVFQLMQKVHRIAVEMHKDGRL